MNSKKTLIGDPDVWQLIPPHHLWVCDKLILSKRLGYLCGPAGVSVPKKDEYVVRPCVNFQMMSKGATIQTLEPNDSEIPVGFFWCERFYGRHLSFDYHYGKQTLSVEGFRESNDKLDRFSKWIRIEETFDLPFLLQEVANEVEWFNVEVIGSKVIEAHFRYNDDFADDTVTEIIPIWKEQFYSSACGDRIGFIIKKSKEN